MKKCDRISVEAYVLDNALTIQVDGVSREESKSIIEKLMSGGIASVISHSVDQSVEMPSNAANIERRTSILETARRVTQ